MRDSFAKDLLGFGFLLVLAVNISSQVVSSGGGDEPRSPKQEMFQKADGLVMPWRETRCTLSYKIRCDEEFWQEFRKRHHLSLYNDDASLWYRFSIAPGNADNFRVRPRSSFMPLADIGGPILRLVAESENWYKVEINEKNREVKYVLKADNAWARVSWDFLLEAFPKIELDPNQTRLTDKPDGEIINASFSVVWFKESSGDWLKVMGLGGRPVFGWIRWRRGRDLLVGCVLNDFKVPTMP